MWLFPFLLILDSFCHVLPYRYDGEGKFNDYGFWARSNRYELVLGPISQGEAAPERFLIGHLPRADFVLALTTRGEGSLDSLTGTRVLLRNNRLGCVVIDETFSMEQWSVLEDVEATKSYTTYRKGDMVATTEYVGADRKVYSFQRTGENSCGGWGTFFESDPYSTYTLSLEMGNTGNMRSDISIVLRSGGMK